MKQKTLREDAHSREAETCRKRPRETPDVPRHILVSYETTGIPLVPPAVPSAAQYTDTTALPRSARFSPVLLTPS